jgi:dihydroorotate dehydrogenase electron transfer subunit
VRLYTATVTANKEVRADARLIEMYVPQLAQSVQPGQYCMLRCSPAQASDPLLRRPFFIHSVQRHSGVCTLLVHVRGRGTSWLAAQREGSQLDVLGPMGHGWSIRSTVSNLLLVSEGMGITGLTYLAQTALEQEVSVTLVAAYENEHDVYPPALLPPEVEYHIVTRDGSTGQHGDILSILGTYAPWADAACLCVAQETAVAVYAHFERLRLKYFAQAALVQPLVCGNGVCLTCSVETRSGAKLVCRDGPVFDLREIAR